MVIECVGAGKVGTGVADRDEVDAETEDVAVGAASIVAPAERVP